VVPQGFNAVSRREFRSRSNWRGHSSRPEQTTAPGDVTDLVSSPREGWVVGDLAGGGFWPLGGAAAACGMWGVCGHPTHPPPPHPTPSPSNPPPPHPPTPPHAQHCQINQRIRRQRGSAPSYNSFNLRTPARLLRGEPWGQRNGESRKSFLGTFSGSIGGIRSSRRQTGRNSAAVATKPPGQPCFANKQPKPGPGRPAGHVTVLAAGSCLRTRSAASASHTHIRVRAVQGRGDGDQGDVGPPTPPTNHPPNRPAPPPSARWHWVFTDGPGADFPWGAIAETSRSTHFVPTVTGQGPPHRQGLTGVFRHHADRSQLE